MLILDYRLAFRGKKNCKNKPGQTVAVARDENKQKNGAN